MLRFILVFVIILKSNFSVFSQSGSVGIGTETPNAKAVLHISSDSKGLLIPRLSETDRDSRIQSNGSINPEINGMLIFNTTSNRFNFWLNNQWNDVSNGAAGPQGIKGDTGAAGAAGAAGSAGPAGIVGAQGPVGLQGPPGDANAWGKSGNSGTTPGQNFAGTTDNQDFVLAANSKQGVRIYTDGSVKLGEKGTKLSSILKVSIPLLDIPPISPGASIIQNFTVPDATSNGAVSVSPGLGLDNGLLIAYARVSSAGNVEVKFTNITFSTINPEPMNYHISVIQ
ncbi:MAG TPA: hypothetical protein VNI52_01755 [Sphingobacteriaceae bacterium]|nr:hypothetical protein [Sphingobacteriaceae bacterium]